LCDMKGLSKNQTVLRFLRENPEILLETDFHNN